MFNEKSLERKNSQTSYRNRISTTFKNILKKQPSSKYEKGERTHDNEQTVDDITDFEEKFENDDLISETQLESIKNENKNLQLSNLELEKRFNNKKLELDDCLKEKEYFKLKYKELCDTYFVQYEDFNNNDSVFSNNDNNGNIKLLEKITDLEMVIIFYFFIKKKKKR
jgi:hypothetical protein